MMLALELTQLAINPLGGDPPHRGQRRHLSLPYKELSVPRGPAQPTSWQAVCIANVHLVTTNARIASSAISSPRIAYSPESSSDEFACRDRKLVKHSGVSCFVMHAQATRGGRAVHKYTLMVSVLSLGWQQGCTNYLYTVYRAFIALISLIDPCLELTCSISSRGRGMLLIYANTIYIAGYTT
ncbi:hypothetical protein BOTBODRAFT_33231 [Botryobasidium botryosum FD-172 SS1]|uniref:Uncharacterized protein n=1 Tax=Botryobasidium botryosum (strain FD-172 SS1) TaxID=930990 RepID=A0A067MGG1_BOTB1|nr:hypothetical protein BOTBODRAFT_33231 [Botryobasidium botryosum FD-172 SS1]